MPCLTPDRGKVLIIPGGNPQVTFTDFRRLSRVSTSETFLASAVSGRIRCGPRVMMHANIGAEGSAVYIHVAEVAQSPA